MTKQPKTGVYDKLKTKSGVIEGGISALKKLKEKPEVLNPTNAVRIAFFVPDELRRKYKALLAEQGATSQQDLLNYVEEFVKKHNK
jgi:hypothetical protein